MLWPPWVILVGTSKVVVISYAWMHPGSKRIWPLVYNEENHQLINPDFVDDWLSFSLENSHPNDVFFGKSLFRLHSHCKIIYWFGWKYYGKRNSLWNDQARQYKSQNKHFRRHRCWSTRVIYSGCRDVDCNGEIHLYYITRYGGAIWRHRSELTLIHTRACRLYGVQPLHDSKLSYCEMDHYEAYPSIIWISFFVPWQYILEFHLQNGGHFVYTSMY